ncbi:MAG: DUF1549 and DUF1553 domain-containing protein [bacterium]|nr:DUF1549 and DUF1553 domain-containing protein [bacterium]
MTDNAWPKNEIDAFVLSKLESLQIAPSPAASSIVQLRRLSLDLTGLLPTRQEINRFSHDTSPDAWENQVDRYLASPHFGERWGRHWLDQARFADSDGYEKDSPRPQAYLYRDWVIKAINDDMPFDQFTREQIAGDLIPNGTPSQKLATAFHVQTLLNREGGIDPEEDRNKRIMDRLATVSTTWMGLTLACSQCHNHPYDPFSQEEYYRFLDFFNHADETKFTAPKIYNRPDPQEVKSAAVTLARVKEASKERRAQWESDARALLKTKGALAAAYHPFDEETVISDDETTFEQQADKSWRAATRISRDTYIFSGKTHLRDITGIRLHVLSDDALPKKGPGIAENGNFVLSRIKVSVHDAAFPGAKDKIIKLTKATADFSQKGWDVKGALNDEEGTGWGIMGGVGEPHRADFHFIEPVTLAGNQSLRITLGQTHGAHHRIGRFKLELHTGHTFPEEIATILNKRESDESDAITTTERKQLNDYYYETIDTPLIEATKAHSRLIALQSERVDVLTERPNRRSTYLYHRGDFLNPSKERGMMVADGQAALHSLTSRNEGQAPDRLDLANWLMADENPLTARVTVNTIWMHLFGEGLVRTIDDFGTRATLPSHPKLLDWLAIEFQTLEWSRKALIKTMVMSATYRQSSVHRPDIAQQDPDNRMHYRQNRIRVEAEIVRDITLQVSGLLDRKMGGNSVFPYLPADIANLSYNNNLKWKTSKDGDAYRRGLYTFFKRTSPYPNLMTFDCPDSNITTAKRGRSNTPLQALLTLQNKTYIEAAQSFGRRLAEQADCSDSEKIDYGFMLAFGRKASDPEQAALQKVFQTGKRYYQNNKDDAKKMAGHFTSKHVDVESLAAWATVARVITNMDAFITRE